MSVNPKRQGLTPEKVASVGTEHAEQVALFMWAALNFETYPELRLMFAIPNGGERNKIVAAQLKAEGVKAYVPDIFLPVARGCWHGLFIELKRSASNGKAEGKASEGQKEYIEELKKQGFGAAIAVGWEQARDMLIAYLTWKG